MSQGRNKNWTEKDDMSLEIIMKRLNAMQQHEKRTEALLVHHLGGQHPDTLEVLSGAIYERIDENHQEITGKFTAVERRVTVLEESQKVDDSSRIAVRGLLYSIVGGVLVATVMLILTKLLG